MVIIETHKFFSDDHKVENPDKEIWQNGSLVYTCKNGLENDDADQVSQFECNPIQTLYITDRAANVQHNHTDDSFYFIRDDGNMNTYIDGQLQIDDPNGDYVEFIEFANSVMSK